MMIVDTHAQAGVNWFEPVEMILHQMNLNGVQKTVLIQHGGNYHNRYVIESTKRFPGRFGAVIWVDVEKPDAPETLERLSKEEGVVGTRLLPTERSPGPDPLAIWRKASELGLTVSCFARSAEDVANPELQKLVEELPNMTLVLEHLAGAYRPLSPQSVTEPYHWYREALTLSRFPNTYIKFGGLGEFAVRPRPLAAQFGFGEVAPLMDLAYDAFGPQRMMWGSDFPPVGGREGYRNSLQGVLELSIWGNQDEKDWAFGKAAVEAFKLG
jgi:L-fuconolactonase